MAIAKVADRGSGNTAVATQSSTPITVTGTTTLNNFIIARVAVDNSGSAGALPGLTVTDSKGGNTWTVTTGALVDPGAASAGSAVYIAYARMANPLVTNDTITFTWGTGTPAAKAIVLEEWSGIHNATPLAVAVVTASGSSTAPTVTITPTAIGQLAYVAVGWEGIAADSYTGDTTHTTGGSWVQLTSFASTDATATNDQRITGMYKVVTATGSQILAVTITSRDWAVAGIVFAEEPAPTAKTGTSENVSLSMGESSALSQTTIVTVTDTLNLQMNESSVVVAALPEALFPDAILTQTNLTGAVTDIDEDPYRGAVTLIIEGNDTTDLATYTTPSVSPAANTLHLLSVSTGNTTGAVTAPTVTGNGLTWTSVGDIQSNNHRTTLFRASGASPTTGAISIAYGGVTQGNCAWRLVSVPNANTTTPVVQSNTGTGTGSAIASVSLGAAVTAGNIVFAAYNQNTATADVAAGTGFNLLGDETLTNPSSPSTRLSNEYSLKGIAPATFVVGSGATWGMVVAEIAITADPDWLNSAGGVVLRVSFPSPSSDLVAGFPQEFRIRVRP